MRMEKAHCEEVVALKEQMERILRSMGELEEKLKADDKEWREFLHDANTHRSRWSEWWENGRNNLRLVKEGNIFMLESIRTFIMSS